MGGSDGVVGEVVGDVIGDVVGEVLGEVVDSEFAQVAVRVDRDANGARLRLEDLRTGRVRFLDALELETVIWLTDEHLSSLMDPSADRYRDG